MAIVTPADLGARVRKLRQARGLTQEQLAEKADLAADTIRRVERGRYGPAFITLVKIAVGFDLTVGQMMRDDIDRAYDFAVLLRGLPDVQQKVAFAVLGTLYIDSLR